MDPEITDTVTGWESVAAGSGYTGLRSLADDEFSGAVTAGLAWAFFLNGRIVGVFDGDIEDFADVDLTAYRAPDPSLSLLFAMRETGGETRGQYYTENTPLTEVDQTLSAGKFTGYVELSENVLSGDYYVVYHAGRSTSVAFVGVSERLVTDEEAFDLAADEVGIYDVVAVDVTLVEIPEDESSGGTAALEDDDASVEREDDGGDRSGFGANDEDAHETTEDTERDDSGSGSGSRVGSVTFGDRDESTGTTPTTADPGRTARDEAGADRAAETEPQREAGLGSDVGDEDSDDEEPVTAATEAAEETADDTAESSDGERDDLGGRDDEDAPEPTDSDAVDGVSLESGITGGDESRTDTEAVDDSETPDEDAEDGERDVRNGESHPAGVTTVRDEVDEAAATDGETEDGGDGWTSTGVGSHDGRVDAAEATDTAEAAGTTESRFTAERQWQETRRIPALDPDDSMDPDDQHVGEEHERSREARTETTETTEASGVELDRSVEKGAGQTEDDAEPRSTSAAGATEPTPDELEAELQAVRETLAATETERDELVATVTELESRLETVTRERDEYREQVADLEAEIERLRETIDRLDGDDAGGEGDLSPTAARDGTNLFVRYRSKGKPTLEDARAGEARQEDIVENLRIEHLTSFDDGTVTVDGESYETFLHATTEWQFVTWVVEELLYEIGRSGHRTDMSALFDRIPEIDRIQFNGEVPVTVEDETGTSHESRAFDLVFWDSMGDPLFVVNLDEGRAATTAGRVESLIEGARAVGTSKDTLGGAFFVTTSYFEPGALDAVGEATNSGLLSRNSKTSFVKLSRKQGYHLCLVEARGDEFHLSVPEL